MRQPTAAESDFVRMAAELFAFLCDDFDCSLAVENDIEGETIRYMNKWVAVELRLESDEVILVEVVPLVAGRIPPRFDPDGSERHTHFPAAELIRYYDPGWEPPATEFAARDRSDLLDVLSQYAGSLRRWGASVLRGDTRPFATIEADMRRRLSLILLEDWARFVERVRTGFSGGIGEYTSAITARGQLESALRHWIGDSRLDPRAQLAQLDRAFDDATEPVTTDELVSSYRVVPDSSAKRWWRRPKMLVGPLREYFERR